jgi:hypothetical protein
VMTPSELRSRNGALKSYWSFCSVVTGCCNMHMHLCDTSIDTCGYSAWTQPGRTTRLPLPYQRSATSNTREKVVHGACSNCCSWGSLTFWLDLHRDVNIWTSFIYFC